MAIEKELLWKAWPEGYLAIRGVGTIAGWQCVKTDRTFTIYGHREAEAEIVFRDGMTSLHSSQAVERGDLLPNVDPTDIATWACLLQDLAQARGLSDCFGLTWRRMTSTRWEVSGYERRGAVFSCQSVEFNTDTYDPAEALVRARIQLRERNHADNA